MYFVESVWLILPNISLKYYPVGGILPGCFILFVSSSKLHLTTVRIFKIDAAIEKTFCCWSRFPRQRNAEDLNANAEGLNTNTEDT